MLLRVFIAAMAPPAKAKSPTTSPFIGSCEYRKPQFRYSRELRHTEGVGHGRHAVLVGRVAHMHLDERGECEVGVCRGDDEHVAAAVTGAETFEATNRQAGPVGREVG